MADKQQSSLSIPVYRFYSANKEDNTSLNLSVWKNKIVFEFLKKNGDNYVRQPVYVDFEVVEFIYSLLENIAKDRYNKYKEGKKYQDVIFKIDNSYIDKDTQEIRKNGNFIIKTVDFEKEKRINISYDSGTDVFSVTLASRLLPKIVEEKYYSKNVDPNDGLFFLFCKMLNDIIRSIAIYAGLNRIAEILFSNNRGNSGNKSYGKNFSGGSESVRDEEEVF
mgnify:CR=1 FL=1